MFFFFTVRLTFFFLLVQRVSIFLFLAFSKKKEGKKVCSGYRQIFRYKLNSYSSRLFLPIQPLAMPTAAEHSLKSIYRLPNIITTERRSKLWKRGSWGKWNSSSDNDDHNRNMTLYTFVARTRLESATSTLPTHNK